jgi:hypothetical protein
VAFSDDASPSSSIDTVPAIGEVTKDAEGLQDVGGPSPREQPAMMEPKALRAVFC